MAVAPFYPYLTEPAWMTSWVEGGEVPLFPARKYLAQERRGTQTPDENLQRSVIGQVSKRAVEFYESMTTSGVAVIGGVFEDETGMHHVEWMDSRPLDSLVLCFSRLLSRSVMHRLEKKAVVRIKDPTSLLRLISRQLGVEGRCEWLKYTKGLERGHEFKGWDDRWQAEIRFYWSPAQVDETRVTLPPGVAEAIDVVTLPLIDPTEATIDWEWWDRHYPPDVTF